jgi:hypothetical protein
VITENLDGSMYFNLYYHGLFRLSSNFVVQNDISKRINDAKISYGSVYLNNDSFLIMVAGAYNFNFDIPNSSYTFDDYVALYNAKTGLVRTILDTKNPDVDGINHIRPADIPIFINAYSTSAGQVALLYYTALDESYSIKKIVQPDGSVIDTNISIVSFKNLSFPHSGSFIWNFPDGIIYADSLDNSLKIIDPNGIGRTVATNFNPFATIPATGNVTINKNIHTDETWNKPFSPSLVKLVTGDLLLTYKSLQEGSPTGAGYVTSQTSIIIKQNLLSFIEISVPGQSLHDNFIFNNNLYMFGDNLDVSSSTLFKIDTNGIASPIITGTQLPQSIDQKISSQDYNYGQYNRLGAIHHFGVRSYGSIVGSTDGKLFLTENGGIFKLNLDDTVSKIYQVDAQYSSYNTILNFNNNTVSLSSIYSPEVSDLITDMNGNIIKSVGTLQNGLTDNIIQPYNSVKLMTDSTGNLFVRDTNFNVRPLPLGYDTISGNGSSFFISDDSSEILKTFFNRLHDTIIND